MTVRWITLMTQIWEIMTSHKKIFLLFLLALLPSLAESKIYLVSVGVSDYPGVENDLRLPVKDAQTMTWLYSRNKDMQYVQLLDQKATVKEIEDAMERVFSKAEANDIVVFFYAGHGYPGGFYVYDGELEYEQIRKAMSRSNCRNKMIFADACFSGKMRTKEHDTGRTSQNSDSNIMLFLSSRSNETSMELKYMDNGLFTTYLQKGLRGGADRNKNRTITAKEIFDYVHSNVVRESKDLQHPVMWGNFRDDMPVIRW